MFKFLAQNKTLITVEYYFIFIEFENLSVEKKDAFDCAGIRAQVFRLPDTQLVILR